MECAPSLHCLGLDKSVVGLFKCILIMWSIETTKRQQYVHESKFEEILSLICALEIEVIVDSSSSLCMFKLSK